MPGNFNPGAFAFGQNPQAGGGGGNNNNSSNSGDWGSNPHGAKRPRPE